MPDDLLVYRTFGGDSLDDTRTEHGIANGEWISRTTWLASGNIEERKLTLKEIEECLNQ